MNFTGLEQGYSVDGKPRLNETTGILTLPFRSVWNVSQLPPGSVAGTVSVYVHTQNFGTFLLELNLYPIDQIKPVADGDITASAITYGDELSKSKISGKMKDPGTGAEVTGTFAWKDGNTKLDAGNYKPEWTFTPDESYNGVYATVTGTVAVKVNKVKAEITVSQKGTLTYNGSAQVAEVEITGADGLGTLRLEYAKDDHLGHDAEVPAFTDAGTYQVHYQVFSTNYDIPTGWFTVTIDPLKINYEDAVDWAVANGITTGIDATHFAPNGVCTRAQAVTFLWRAAGSPAPKTATMPYTDVPAGSYYHDAVLWAVENGITKGTSETTFSPNATCSRAQIVTFLWRAEKSPAAGSGDPFTDVKPTAYYADAVLWAVAAGITKGTTDTTFSPNDDCTRAQIVTFLWRCMK